MDILIAEDDYYSRTILQKILDKFGHKTEAVDNGLKAWDLFQEKDFSMIISDWMMPEMDGLTLCRKIREMELSRYIYILLLTAKDSKQDTVTGFEAGADDYVVKPFEPEELMARIRAGQRIIQLEEDHKRYHGQLLQSDKMTSIGQLAAGVAHEINNPIGFVSSNLKTLEDYQEDTQRLIL
jgi:two-component system NtrC family sensor kinase